MYMKAAAAIIMMVFVFLVVVVIIDEDARGDKFIWFGQTACGWVKELEDVVCQRKYTITLINNYYKDERHLATLDAAEMKWVRRTKNEDGLLVGATTDISEMAPTS
jgi:hypothetical protein